MLENISGTFSKPNIIDIKLGTILYDDEASEEKKARMTKTAMNTTSFETGVRLTGFQVRSPCQLSNYDLSTTHPDTNPLFLPLPVWHFLRCLRF